MVADVAHGDDLIQDHALKKKNLAINSIAFGSAPRREAGGQPIKQLIRQAVNQTVTWASTQADVNTQFRLAGLASCSGENMLCQNKPQSNGNASPLGRLPAAPAKLPTGNRTTDLPVGCITIQPVLVLTVTTLHCLKPSDQKLLTPPPCPPPQVLSSFTDRGGIFARSAHCALLLDYVPPEEPLSTPLGNALRIR